MAPVLALVSFYPLPTKAFPFNVDVQVRAFYPSYSSSNSSKLSGVDQAVFSIIIVLLCLFCAFCAAACHVRKPRGQGRRSSGIQRGRLEGRAPYDRTMVGYTSNAERGNTPIEIRGAEARAKNSSNHSISQTNSETRHTRHSAGILPLYKEQAPHGKVVLLERERSISDDEDDHSGDETENAPLVGAAPPYTDSNQSPGAQVLQVTIAFVL